MDRNELERLADKAGLGKRSKKKLLDALDQPAEAQTTGSEPAARPRGHGAPAQSTETVPEI